MSLGWFSDSDAERPDGPPRDASPARPVLAQRTNMDFAVTQQGGSPGRASTALPDPPTESATNLSSGNPPLTTQRVGEVGRVASAPPHHCALRTAVSRYPQAILEFPSFKCA